MARKKAFKPKFETYEDIQETITQATQMLAKEELDYMTHKGIMTACNQAIKVLENKGVPKDNDSILEIVWNEAPTDTILDKLGECLKKGMTLQQAYQECLKFNSGHEGENDNEIIS